MLLSWVQCSDWQYPSLWAPGVPCWVVHGGPQGGLQSLSTPLLLTTHQPLWQTDIVISSLLPVTTIEDNSFIEWVSYSCGSMLSLAVYPLLWQPDIAWVFCNATFLAGQFPMVQCISGKAGPGSAGRVEPSVSHTVFTVLSSLCATLCHIIIRSCQLL